MKPDYKNWMPKGMICAFAAALAVSAAAACVLRLMPDGALKTANMIETMDNMMVAYEDLDSFDPLIKLHLFHKTVPNRTKERVEEFCDRYQVEDTGIFMSEAAKAKNKEELDEAIREYLPCYFQLKDKITAKDSKAKAAEWREAFKEISDIKKSGKKVPHDLANKMAGIGGEYMMMMGIPLSCL